MCISTGLFSVEFHGVGLHFGVLQAYRCHSEIRLGSFHQLLCISVVGYDSLIAFSLLLILSLTLFMRCFWQQCLHLFHYYCKKKAIWTFALWHMWNLNVIFTIWLRIWIPFWQTFLERYFIISSCPYIESYASVVHLRVIKYGLCFSKKHV